MNTSPPNDVGICAAFSVSNCGNSVPKPSASRASANVISVIVITDTANMNVAHLQQRVRSRRRSPSASTSSGSVPTQNFAHSSSRIGIGLDRSSHSVRPSRLTPGKMNRAAIDASTKPGEHEIQERDDVHEEERDRLRRCSGRNLMLKT